MLPQLEVHSSSRGKQLNYADKIYKTKNSKFQPDSKLDIISFNIAEIPRMPWVKINKSKMVTEAVQFSFHRLSVCLHLCVCSD